MQCGLSNWTLWKKTWDKAKFGWAFRVTKTLLAEPIYIVNIISLPPFQGGRAFGENFEKPTGGFKRQKRRKVLLEFMGIIDPGLIGV